MPISDDDLCIGARGPDALVLAEPGQVVPIVPSEADFPGVLRAVADLADDIERVAGVRPVVHPGRVERSVVWIGTLGRHPAIEELIARGRLDASELAGRRESWQRELVEAPASGVARALVIVGSDQRGTIYGIYELSRELGVSPWYFWADVPVRRRRRLLVGPERRVSPEPGVRYRGIFLNDEEPALGGWVREKFGGFSHAFYARVFELLLRLRANYLWPAMWNSAFNEDDPENARMAQAYGIIMGTSHHEPMLRSQQEWKRHGSGPWDYAKNGATLRDFWRQGIRRNRDYESVITVGMRGDGDLAMAEDDDVRLLEQVLRDQRAILGEELGRDPALVPQVWALYQEVQGYFERGMRVPDDVTLLWCDDNWGNLRRLPTPGERARAGGAGIYYHLDYVGDPRSYKWLSTVPITKLWEQMHLAWQYGADRLWIVNVGDLKPMEFALEFFLELAWSPAAMTLEALEKYPHQWAEREFGPEHAGAIASLMERQATFVGRRKPELLAPDTYSLFHYGEAERVVSEYRSLERDAAEVDARLSAEHRPAFFQLVHYPIQACANLADLYVTVGQNRAYAVQGRASTNALFERARSLFRRDAELGHEYNDQLLAGQWRHLMDQVHIGYTYWQQPVRSSLPAVTELALPDEAALGVAVEGDPRAWPTDDPNQPDPVLPALDVYDRGVRYIDVFSRGEAPLGVRARARESWLRVSPERAELGRGLESERRLEVTVDWAEVPHGEHQATVDIEADDGRRIEVVVPVINPDWPRPSDVPGFVETGRRLVGRRPPSADPEGLGCRGRLGGGYVAMEAEHFTRAVCDSEASWRILPGHGRTLSGITPWPVTMAPRSLGPDGPRLEYRCWFFSAGELEVALYFSPTLDFAPERGLRCGVSFDAAAPLVLQIVASGSTTGWAQAVEDGVRIVRWRATVAEAGSHDFKFWMIDPGVVLQKIVIDAGGAQACYLGPPESFRGWNFPR